ncbi:MAG: ABC transporter ATP-binding protein [Verrucomicrobia bacterium]|nr:ABC transporter ATP-binding protein [Verrucomicrobiota bacterium]
MIPLLELCSVGKVYPGGVATRALEEVSFAVAPGEFVALVGASGSGKTTLLNLVGLLDTPTEGSLRLAGRDVTGAAEDLRAELRRDLLGFVFQFHYLLPEFTALENALMPLRIRGTAAEDAGRARVRALLEKVDLGDRLHHRPGQLSGGQQQRVAVVRALANDPQVILADEPTGNLDSRNAHAVCDLLRSLTKELHKSVLLVTHDETIAAKADRILHLRDGRLVT